MSTDVHLAILLKRCIQIFAEDIFPAEQYIEMKAAERALDEWIEKEKKTYAQLVQDEDRSRDRKIKEETELFLGLCEASPGRRRGAAKVS